MSTKKLKECYFVIYDMEDNVVAYLDSFIEISNFVNLRICDISKRYKNGYVFIMNKKFYKLVAFLDKE